MSTDTEDTELSAPGVPELTPLGKHIELLRIERRLSKTVLAQRAGTSRQQLWRVMTGKSELTSSLCARLSDVLEIDSRRLRTAIGATSRVQATGARFGAPSVHGVWSMQNALARHTNGRSTNLYRTLEEYVSAPDGLTRTFDTLPTTEDGRRLKRVLLDAIEDIAIARSLKLPQAIFDLRRSVVNDDA